MKVNSPGNITKLIIIWLIAILLLAACSSTASPEVETPPEPDIQEPAPPEPPEPLKAKVDEAPLPSAQLPEGEVRMDDMLYPGAEFLFEVDGIGGPMVPYRFYALRNTSIDQAIAFYSERLPGFKVEQDRIENGHRQLLLAHPSPMEQMNNVEGMEDLMAISREMDRSLLGVEIGNSSAHSRVNRIGYSNEVHQRADDLPSDTTIVVLEYFANPY